MTKRNNQQSDWRDGEYIIYQNGDTYEIGRIKSIRNDGAFVAYHEGETGAKTPFECMHKIRNEFTIKKTSLAWEYFDDAVIPWRELDRLDIPEGAEIKVTNDKQKWEYRITFTIPAGELVPSLTEENDEMQAVRVDCGIWGKEWK